MYRLPQPLWCLWRSYLPRHSAMHRAQTNTYIRIYEYARTHLQPQSRARVFNAKVRAVDLPPRPCCRWQLLCERRQGCCLMQPNHRVRTRFCAMRATCDFGGNCDGDDGKHRVSAEHMSETRIGGGCRGGECSPTILLLWLWLSGGGGGMLPHGTKRNSSSSSTPFTVFSTKFTFLQR